MSAKRPSPPRSHPRTKRATPKKARTSAALSAFDATRYLNSDEAVAEFIDAALNTGNPAVLVRALGEVARAHGMAVVARRSGLARESLYKALRPSSHPRLDTILRVARAVGVRFHASAA